jgi:hypothetical protein
MTRLPDACRPVEVTVDGQRETLPPPTEAELAAALLTLVRFGYRLVPPGGDR